MGRRLFIVIFAILVGLTAQAAATVLRVGYYDDKPLVYRDDEGHPAGLYVTLLQNIARREGWDLVWQYGTFRECLTRLETSQIDLMTAIAWTPERTTQFSFNRETFFTNWGIVYLHQDDATKSLSDLDNHRIGLVSGDVYATDFLSLTESFHLKIRPVMCDSYEAVLQQVETGEVDAGVVNRIVGRELESEFSIYPSSIIFHPVSLRVAAPFRGSRHVLDIIDHYLVRWRDDRSSIYYKALEETLQFPRQSERLLISSWPRWIWGLLILAAAMALAAFIVLRNLLKKRTRSLREKNRELEFEKAFREKAERETYANQIYYGDIIESMQEGFLIGDAENCVTFANQSLLRMLECTHNELYGIPILELVAGEDRDVLRAELESIRYGKATTYELNLHSRTNTVFPVIVSPKPIFSESGAYIGLFILVHDVSEIQRTRSELTLHRAYFQQLFQYAPEAIVMVDQEDVIQRVNPGFEMMFGYSQDEAAGKPLNSLIVPEAQFVEATQISRAVLHRQTQQRETLRKRKDGSLLDVEISGFPIMTSNEQVGVFGIYRDITRRKAEERELFESRAKFQTIFRSSPIGLMLEGMDGSIIDCNRALQVMTGFSYQELCAKKARDLLFAEDAQVKQERGESGLRFNTVYKRKSGEELPVIISGSLVELGDERYLLESVQDISGLVESERALGAEKERLAVTLASIGDAVIATDVAGRITILNRVAAEMTGWNETEAIGRPLAEVFRIVHEETREPIPDPVTKVLQLGHAIELANHTQLVARDGRELIIVDSAAPIRDRQNRVAGVILVFRDVTERRLMERELMKTQKLEDLGVLAGGIAHDFNNILTAIIGNIALAKLYEEDPQQMLQKIENAEKAALQAKDLTYQLLTFAKGGEPIRSMADLGGILRETTSFSLAGSNVKCVLHIPPDLATVNVDAGQISQVIHNLVINAGQAMPDGGRIDITAANVTIAAGDHLHLAPGDYVRLEVADTGKGIPADIINRIFEPYFSTKKPGNGLGLATTYSIMKKHGGHIQVESAPGKGARFTLWLPVSQESGTFTDDTRALLFGQGQRILVMDDEQVVLETVSEYLQHLAYKADMAHDGQQAVDLYARAMEQGDPFAAVIIDITIPGGMGGKECIARLRELDPNVKAVVSSGYRNDPVLADYRAYGFIGRLDKPYAIEDIGRLLYTVLGGEPAE